MSRNLHKTDRLVRTLIAIVLLVLLAKTNQSLTINWVLLLAVTTLLGTADVGYCPLYRLVRSLKP